MSSIDRCFNEKRNFIRMKINSDVIMTVIGEQYRGVCKNLSGTGMSIETSNSFEQNTQLELSIAQQGETHLPFNARGQISRVEKVSEGRYMIGISISEIF
ncbi:MAG: hypothetical protein ACJAYG_000422 [Oceanicoccus sp.]|jgi:hypothetical protein